MLHPWGAQAETQDRNVTEDGAQARGRAGARVRETRRLINDFSYRGYFLVITSKLRLDLLTCVDVYYEH